MSEVASPEPVAQDPVAAAAHKHDLNCPGHSIELNPKPEWIEHRIRMYDELKKKADEALAAKVPEPIKITLPDGRIMDGQSWRTTPFEIAKSISKSLADRVVIAKVNGQLFDLGRPLEASCDLQLLDFENDEGKAVFWHSSAHVLGEACERYFGSLLGIGPPVEEGFFYEMGMGDRVVVPGDYDPLNKIADSITKEKQPFERLVVSKTDLLEMFKHNPFKVHLINEKVADGGATTVYRCGTLIDYCIGPHVPNTNRIKAMEVVKHSSSYFLGNADNASLQRIYGISFPDKAMMKEWKKWQEEAKKRDHRKIGKEQELFFFHELSPGSCFFQPYGARIYNTLVEFIRSEYRKRGFSEVVTPNVYNVELWKTSGHWQNYQENMFSFQVEKDTFALKPMNCPGHCLMFGVRDRSYRELPLRLADFGVLHRNEFSGALSGLTRVRRFQQDDAHIFCTQDQIGEEMKSCLDFLKHVYGIFGFTFSLRLSTRPEKFLGEIAVWNEAEKKLQAALDAFGEPWELNPGDGAFYGPKIDITIMDAMRRKHQCATIQLDFQLPIRFDLKYRTGADTASDFEKPVIIHRAVLGSVERMIAILTESFGGKWPFWLSPRQVMVVPVAHTFDEYAQEISKLLNDEGFYAEADVSDLTMNKKIRNAQVEQFNFQFVVGEKERTARTVNVRRRIDTTEESGKEIKDVLGEMSLDDVVKALHNLKKTKSNLNAL